MALFVTVMGVLLLVPDMAQAAPVDLFPSGACGASTVCANSGNQNVSGIFKTVINILIWVAGIISVIVIIVGGIQYALSAGDQSKVTKAKDTILYAVIGLVVAILAFAIVTFVTSKL